MKEVDLMRLLAGIGGAITLIETILGINERNVDSSRVISIVISIILAVIILLGVIRPGDPVPIRNGLLFVGLGIVIIIFSSSAGGILILVAGFIGYAEK